MTGLRSWFSGRFDNEVRPSIEKRIEAGTVLFRAGELCHAVALIRDGEIELLAERDGRSVQVGKRGRGAFVGDDEVLGDGMWHRTARALRRSRVEMLPRDLYLERFAEHAARTASGLHVRLQPGSPESAAALPVGGLDITDFPFIVGRASADRDAAARRSALLLADTRPYRLSRRQFVIVTTTDGIALSDPGSCLGTFVDGHRLGPDPLPLRPGESVEIHAGGRHSRFRFELTVH